MNDKCEEIALGLEPQIPTHTPKVTGRVAGMSLLDSSSESPLKVWRYDFALKSWQPLDFYSDESACALVLEAMPRVRLDFHPARLHGKELKSMAHWVCIPDRDDQYKYESCPDRKTCICEAFLAFLKEKAR